MPSSSTPLPRSFYQRPTLVVARDLLGKRLVKLEDGQRRLSGHIVEVEAYIGTDDLACHARAGRTKRNKTMWGPPGHSYIYFIYGIHWMLNVVTEEVGKPAAILIRSLLPEDGITIMRRRRSTPPEPELTNGPAKICQALGITQQFDGTDMCDTAGGLWLEDAQQIPDLCVTTGPRVGLNNVPEPWKSMPWRFQLLPGVDLSEEE